MKKIIFIPLVFIGLCVNSLYAIIENVNDFCYEEPVQSGWMCMSMGPCAGGLGCKITYPIKNISKSKLSKVTVVYDETGLGGSFGNSCGVTPSGQCDTQGNIDMGPIGMLGKTTEYKLPDLNPKDSAGVWVQSFMGMSCFNGSSLYGTYIKNGEKHRGAIPPCSEVGNNLSFAQRYTTNLKGNLKVIGNTVLKDDESVDGEQNSEVVLAYVNIDPDSEKKRFNSSSAMINATEAGVDISHARIHWAGLYWQGYLHNDDEDDGIDSEFDFPYSTSANKKIPSYIQNQTILFKMGKEGYKSISPDQVNMDQEYGKKSGEKYISFKYAAFANVTSLLKNKAPNTTYTVANIPTRSGRTRTERSSSGFRSSGGGNDGLGTYGAWSLVIIYDNNSSTKEKTRNMTVYDGYAVIKKDENDKQTIQFDGFLTPKRAPDGVDSTISIFAGEGDKNILGDKATLTNQDGYSWALPNATGTNSYFASAIEGVPNRNPKITNNNGIDIHTTQIGTRGGASRPIKTSHHSASLTLETTGDTFMPSMIAFATELYTPKLCYDYDVRVGQHIKISSNDRKIDTHKWGNEDLTLTLLIRSEISDFPISDSRLNVTFSPSTLKYKKGSSKISPADTNRYHSIGEIDLAKGQIGIGHGATKSIGGTIDALESTYIKQDFSFTEGRFNGTFDLTIEGKIQFGSSGTPVLYTLSTLAPADSPNHISRCETNPVYDPIWTNFNIERSDSNAGQSAEKRYPLYTQITGKDFNISLVSYTADGADGIFDDEKETSTTVELQIIDASIFENNKAAGYDSTCEEPGPLGSGVLIPFEKNGKAHSRVNVQIPKDIPNFNNDVALHSAAFRMWVLTLKQPDGSKKIINHQCTLDGKKKDCFKKLYKDAIQEFDRTKVCQSACVSSYSAATCYECLRENFSTPICSRDNFSIRPESFRVQISDNNESDQIKKQRLTDNSSRYNTPNKNLALAAGYKYAIDVNATLYNTSQNAKGYYNEYFLADENITNLGSKTKNNTLAALEFKGGNTCSDKTHRTYGLKFQNGLLDNKSYIRHHNVGAYRFWMLDSNWTNVDQARYPFKVRFGTCQVGDTRDICTDCDRQLPSSSSRNRNGKLGCTINSNLQGGEQSKNDNYREIPLRFEPYQFNLSDVNISLPNQQNFVYTNNILAGNIPNLSMAVNFNGNIVAENKKGNRVNNFTKTCAAHPVMFDLKRVMHSGKKTLDEHKIKGKDIRGVNSIRPIFFQSNHIDRENKENYQKNDKNSSIAIRVGDDQFRDSDKGSAQVDIYYNFTKSFDHVSNPINVRFISKEANATAARLAAHLQVDYLPSGSSPIGTAVDFYYGRIMPSQVVPYIAAPDEATIEIPLFVDVYCNNDEVDCTTHGLNGTPRVDDWWANIRHNSAIGDGQILEITNTKK